MTFRQRISLAYGAMTTKGLTGQPLGTVMRNYGKKSAFRPQEQVQGITYKAIDKIGTSLSIYEPIITKAGGDAVVNHPIYALFNNPNPKQNATDFIHLFGMLYEIYGETFWYLVRGDVSKKIKEVYLLNPAAMEVKTSNGELIGYILHKSNGDQIPLMPDEIYHDKRPNPFNEWRGLSVLEKASMYIDIEITTTQFTLSYMQNNASPSGIVSLPNMDKNAFKQFAQQWREGYEGPENAGKTAFIRGGEADFKAVGATLKDIDQKVTRDMAKEDVLMMLEVPKSLLGISSDKGFGRADIEALNYVFAKEKIDPIMKRLDRIYSTILKENFQTAGQIQTVTHMSVIPEDKEFQLKTYEKGANVWLTVNEIRAEQGLEPLKGFDELKEKATPNIATTPEIKSAKKTITLKKKMTKAQETKKINDTREEFRSNLVRTNEIYVAKIKTVFSKFLKEQEALIINSINATSKAYEEWLFSVKEESPKLAAALTPVIIELMEAQSEGVANFITGELLVITPEIERGVEVQILKLSGDYNTETIKSLEKTLTQGNIANDSLASMKKRVESVYSDARGYRAKRIAQTEGLRASNQTAQMVYKQNGYSSVQWFTNPGACEFCSTFQGNTTAIGENFMNLGDVLTSEAGNTMSISYDNIDVPPLHPNCKCSIVPGS